MADSQEKDSASQRPPTASSSRRPASTSSDHSRNSAQAPLPIINEPGHDVGSPARRPQAGAINRLSSYSNTGTSSRPASANLTAPPVRLRRLPSSNSMARPTSSGDEPVTTGRRRSTSAPMRPISAVQTAELNRQSTNLSAVKEELSHSNTQQMNTLQIPQAQPVGRPRAKTGSSRNRLSRQRSGSNASRDSVLGPQSEEYNANIINMLDVVDPQVSTLTTLNNVQNSLFIPYLGRYFNRTPTYDLTRHINEDLGGMPPSTPRPEDRELEAAELTEQYREQSEQVEEVEEVEETGDRKEAAEEDLEVGEDDDALVRSHTLTSIMTGTNYAVLPHGVSLEGWSAEDKEALNDHVRHLLHSRRAAFKRSMKGFGQYVRKPLGFFVTLYAFLLTFWGAAWVLFLIGWIHAGDRQQYFVEICDQILTALFCMVGLGLAPFRAIDTYHMIYIAKYHYKTWQLRQERNMPDLADPNDLPSRADPSQDVELADLEKQDTEAVLTPEEEAKFLHHQKKFMQSHTFYKPHETETHNAFSIKLLITVVVLLDFHSFFQAALGGTTWGINYHHRPKALTAVILTCSICCNISGGVTIAVGDRRSRKTKIVEQMFRQALTQTAIDQLKKERGVEPTSRLVTKIR